MKLFNKCQGCKKIKFIIKKRNYKGKIIGTITSLDDLCYSCYKAIKNLVKTIK